mmetsp:Transcript_40944/g.64926  ORF Transcript_40944/g.64926 Transcript_40944/m.64926 type:complete len:203 (-) Transcript_40944:84-692(-)|eukprot:CAMPEP_0169365506 /NCGR_PEP_ID=MMETSP1017-20121227/32594_1 /TAXON_ID=342587 /ORGANISM="Karlodinium micrum, Strain CCMP2283" /LENGTH=202 /DNA_ID=CAMNT_0009463329 /DNA_START=66 /DNA_END=674 /DNA_ORIENTATION=-
MFANPPFPRPKESTGEYRDSTSDYSKPAETSSQKAETPLPRNDFRNDKDGFSDLPFDEETITKNRRGRNAYMEAREAVELEQKERKGAREALGKELREKCRPEIDEYIDCCVGRIFTMFACRPEALKMRVCLKKLEKPEFIEQRMTELLKKREESGESVVNNADGRTRERRALYNRAILPTVDDATEFTIRNHEPGAPKPAS